MHRANYLYDAYWRAQGAKDRAEIKDALEALFRGEHPDFLGVKIEHAAFDLKSIPTWDTAFVYVLKNVPTHDKGIMFKHRPTRDEEPEELFDDDGQAVEMIMSALKDLAARCDALDKLPMFRAPTQGPAMTPRILNPQQAYQAAMTAYQMEQAKINQRRAHEAMPDTFPAHPDDVKEDVEEQQRATGDTRHPRHMIARKHLTFVDAKAINASLKQNIEPRAIREREANLMADMQKQIQGEDK